MKNEKTDYFNRCRLVVFCSTEQVVSGQKKRKYEKLIPCEMNEESGGDYYEKHESVSYEMGANGFIGSPVLCIVYFFTD